jgi:hypothetical protein
LAYLLNILKRKNEDESEEIEETPTSSSPKGGKGRGKEKEREKGIKTGRKSNDNEDENTSNKKQYFLISATWVQLAIPFIEEFINENTQIREEEFFNTSKIFNKCIAIFDSNSNTKIKSSNFVYPNKVNNHDIIEYKDFWYDFEKDYCDSNVFLSRNAKENQNFFYINKKNWKLLVSIFGCINEVPRFSLMDNTNKIDTNLIKVKKYSILLITNLIFFPYFVSSFK